MSGVLTPPIVMWWIKPNPSGPGYVPADGYYAAYYGAGLDPISANYKEIYGDIIQSAPIANPVALDVEGKWTAVLGNGGYKIVIWDRDPDAFPLDAIQKFVIDDVSGNTSFGTGFVANITDLRAVTQFNPPFIYMAGYYNPTDGGQGMFYWDPADSTPDDNGYTITPDSSPANGRWKRIPDENGDVRAASFGYIPTSATIQTAQLTQADAYAASIFATLLIEAGTDAYLETTMHFTAPFVECESAAGLKGTSLHPVAITFDGIFIAPSNFRFGAHVLSVAFSDSQISDTPQWFGASTANIAADNDAAFLAQVNAGGGAFEIPPGVWPVTDVTAFPFSGAFWSLLGVLSDSSPATIGPGVYGSTGSIAHLEFFQTLNNRYISADGSDGQITDKDWKVGRNLSVLGDSAITGNETVTTLIASGLIQGSPVTSTTTVRAGSDVRAGTSGVGNVIAGFSGAGGYLQAQAGTGTENFKAGGVIAGGNLNASTASLSLGANSLVNDGDKAIVEAGGTIDASGTGTVTFTIKLNGSGTTLATLQIKPAGAGSSFPWFIRSIIRKNGTNVINIQSMITGDGTFTQPCDADAQPSIACTLTNTNTLDIAVSGSSATNIQGADLTFNPAHP